MSHGDGLDFSFSGLKTALVYAVEKLEPAEVEERRADLAASFQSAVVGQLVAKVRRALDAGEWRALALGGGVAANALLRERSAALCEERGIRLKLVEPRLCTDNAAMIGSAARYAERDRLPRLPRPRRGPQMTAKNVVTLFSRPGLPPLRRGPRGPREAARATAPGSSCARSISRGTTRSIARCSS